MPANCLKKNLPCLLLIILLMPFSSQAQTSISKLFKNSMVLQRGQEIFVWGWGNTGSTVTVTLADSVRETVTDANGKWSTSFAAMEAGGPYTMSVVSGDQTINISDIMIGDVFMISGQSNMEFALSSSDGGSAEAASANYPNIREFKIPKSTANELSDQLANGSWKKATSSSSAGSFSAVGYYFAKELQAEIDVPIGLVNNSYGGARIEAFMSEQMLGYDETDITLANGETERQPTLIYNKMVHPVLPFAYKGILWYQAESNGDSMEDALAYGEQFKLMISSWRDSLGLGDLPFIWVQLPNYGEPAGDTPSTWDAWPQLRAQQSSALTLPNTGEVITIDVGDVDIHPTNKEPVGYRLSLAARNLIYGEDIVASSPRYRGNALTDSSRVIINFDGAGSGLIAQNSAEGSLNAFALAGEDGQFVWANAEIQDDDQVIVWNDDIPDPVTIRYAWEYNPGTVNLYNAEGLPAAPFQTAVNPGFKIGSFGSARSAIEQGQSTTISWQVFNASSVMLDGLEVDSAGTQSVSPVSTTTYELIAVNRDDSSQKDTAHVTVEVLDPEEINRTFGQPVTASTYESCCDENRIPEFAVDEDLSTRWSSAWSDGTGDDPEEPNYDGTPDDEWIMVDLGEYIDINRVILQWEAAYGTFYDIEVSYDSYAWNPVFSEYAGNGDEDNITFETPVTGRYLRMHGIERATRFGYSLFEMAAYGSVSEVQPPEVSLYTDFGNIVEPEESAIIISAEASDANGSVQQVGFYVNGELFETDTEAPFSSELELDGSDEYTIHAIATDNDDLAVQSAPFILYVENSYLSRFEAENAVATGDAIQQSSGTTSGGGFMDLRDAWTLTFPEFMLWLPGEKLISIGYQLTYESPKSQYLVINGDTVETIEFTAPDNTTWMKYATTFNFENNYDNQIAIHGFWNWMSIDYIAVEDVNGGLAIDEETGLPTEFALNQNYPNPFNPTTQITYEMPTNDRVKLQVFDVTGRLVSTLIDGIKAAGVHSVQFDAQHLSSGIYFYQLSGNFGVKTNRMTLIK